MSVPVDGLEVEAEVQKERGRERCFFFFLMKSMGFNPFSDYCLMGFQLESYSEI